MGSNRQNECKARVLLIDLLNSGTPGRYTLRCQEPQHSRLMEVQINPQARKEFLEAVFALDDFIGALDAVPVIMVSFNHDHPLLLKILDAHKKECAEQEGEKEAAEFLRKCTVEELLLACGVVLNVPADLPEENQPGFMLDAFNFCRHYLGYSL